VNDAQKKIDLEQKQAAHASAPEILFADERFAVLREPGRNPITLYVASTDPTGRPYWEHIETLWEHREKAASVIIHLIEIAKKAPSL
jgi:hypothetical protein